MLRFDKQQRQLIFRCCADNNSFLRTLFHAKKSTFITFKAEIFISAIWSVTLMTILSIEAEKGSEIETRLKSQSKNTKTFF